MANKIKTVFVCNSCGEVASRWMGKCPACGEWNTMVEDVVKEKSQKSIKTRITANALFQANLTKLNEISASEDQTRFHTGLTELDRVLGGGIVKGSLILLGGEPGAGKSTLLLQISGSFTKGLKILYVSGEESSQQIKLRANRLGVENDDLYISAQTEIEGICTTIITDKPNLVIIDSIQTMFSSEISSSPGSVSQVKESTSQLLNVAKTFEIPIFIVGHVNKDGAIAGPKVMEHIVDTVLYFEGDKSLPYRVLRAVKNRYGSTNEIGMFDMTNTGLKEITNPSKMLLEGRPEGVSGNCVACTMEGSRPILSEIQALVSKTGFGTPRRTTSGLDYNRANLLIAVIEKRAGYNLNNLDIYLNIVGGLELDDTACDLTIAMAIVSSLLDKPIDDDTVVIGEIGLGGEVRSVSNLDTRLREVSRLGFKRAIIPAYNIKALNSDDYPMELIGVQYLRQAIALI